jgi:hypothetical protein
MAVGPDRVQVLKQESAANGGDGADDVPYTVSLSPQEDALEAAGVYFQDALNRDENVWIERNGNDMRFRDLNNTTPVTLTSLLGGASATDYAFRRLFSLMGA